MRWTIDPLNHYIPKGTTAQKLWDACGVLPHFISEEDSRPALVQFRQNYRYGVHALPRVTIAANGVMQYPEDPPQFPFAQCDLRDERIYIYPSAFVAIVQTDGSAFVTRMD